MPTILSNLVALVATLSSVVALPQRNNGSSPSVNPSVNNGQPSTNLCGNDQHIILDGTPWLVANSMYGAGSMVGTSCTNYDHIDTSAGNPRVVWGSTTNIQDIGGT